MLKVVLSGEFLAEALDALEHDVDNIDCLISEHGVDMIPWLHALLSKVKSDTELDEKESTWVLTSLKERWEIDA